MGNSTRERSLAVRQVRRQSLEPYVERSAIPDTRHQCRQSPLVLLFLPSRRHLAPLLSLISWIQWFCSIVWMLRLLDVLRFEEQRQKYWIQYLFNICSITLQKNWIFKHKQDVLHNIFDCSNSISIYDKSQFVLPKIRSCKPLQPYIFSVEYLQNQ